MRLLTAFLLATSLTSFAGINGYVFIDKNNNGLRDANEEGIKNVAVSDQLNVVLTDANGRYEIDEVKGFGIVMITLPDGYKPSKSYWQKIVEENAQHDFALIRTSPITEFKFIHASDTHLSQGSTNRTQRLKTMADSLKPDFVLVSGDLIKDALRVPETEAAPLYELYLRETKKFSMPVWSAPGNHEIFGIERHLSLVSPKNPMYGKKMFRNYLGPNYYSFNYGGVHFVALDDVDYEDLWYYGHVDSLQVEWLKKDLAAIPALQPVVTFAHMPFFSGGLSLSNYEEDGPGRSLEKQNGKTHFRHVVSNAQELIGIISTHPYPLSLAGHFHARQIFLFEADRQKTRYEQAAAIVGPAGEGAVVMTSGFTLYTVKNGQIGEGKFVRLDKK
jgi:predicted MPP superfamily phosphohydrolase